MNTRALLESQGRLEALKSGGRLEAAKRAIEAGHPFVEQLGLDIPDTLDALDMSPGQLEAAGTPLTQLEAIVRLVTRPPMVVENGAVSLIPLPDEFGADIDIKIKRNEHWLGSVGRVEFINHSMTWGGTAWVVGEEADGRHLLVVTNRHVAKIVARRNARGEGVFMRSPFTMVRYGARVDFNEEVGALPSDERPAEILRFTYLADDASADVAIGRIEKPAGFAVAPLPLVDTDAETDEIVAVIGYPAFDSRNDRTEMEKYFKGLYDVKRFAPGKMMPVAPGTVLSHDCTTLGGNSGSPILSLDRNKVVGLHFAGAYGIANSAVRASTLRDLLSGNRPTQVLVEASLEQEVADGFHDPNHFTDRNGYDPNFLSKKVDFPKLPDGLFNLASPTDALAGRPHELRYTHFGLLYDVDRRSPVVTVVNIDGEKAIKIKRKKPDKWFSIGAFLSKRSSARATSREIWTGDTWSGARTRTGAMTARWRNWQTTIRSTTRTPRRSIPPSTRTGPPGKVWKTISSTAQRPMPSGRRSLPDPFSTMTRIRSSTGSASICPCSTGKWW